MIAELHLSHRHLRGWKNEFVCSGENALSMGALIPWPGPGEVPPQDSLCSGVSVLGWEHCWLPRAWAAGALGIQVLDGHEMESIECFRK